MSVSTSFARSVERAEIETIMYIYFRFDYVGVNQAATGCKLMCCGTNGDKIKFKKAVCCCPSVRYCGETVESIYVPIGEGNDIAEVIKTARDNARARMN